MGWSGGSGVAIDIIKLAKKHVPEASKAAFYKGLLEALESEDWDCQSEAEGIDPAFDKALRKAHPSWYEHEREEP